LPAGAAHRSRRMVTGGCGHAAKRCGAPRQAYPLQGARPPASCRPARRGVGVTTAHLERLGATARGGRDGRPRGQGRGAVPAAHFVAAPLRSTRRGQPRSYTGWSSEDAAWRMSERFELVSPYAPAGDQPYAIEKLVEGFEAGLAKQVLLGVTGSGKTYTIANVVQQVQKPTLVMAHNKTLAAQLYGEFKAFFPNNAVEYFVSYYDYYQPEAYVPSTDTFIEKDSSINDHIEQMRLAATKALLSRRDVLVVATVS